MSDKDKDRTKYETVFGIRREPGTGRWKVFSIAVDTKRMRFHSTGQAEEQALTLLRLALARERTRGLRGIA